MTFTAALLSLAVGAGPVTIQGAGATFPYPLYSKWIAEYQKLEPTVRVDYQSIGSGGGIRQLLAGTVDFGASDAPMNAQELAKATKRVLHVPTALGAVVVAFNLGNITALKLSPATVSGLFLGEITTWNDPRIAKENPGVKLPAVPVTVISRSDGSGTTAVFSEYLSKVSPTWKEKVGSGKALTFPVGLGAKGNEGVAGQVKGTNGGVGYLELAYAKQANISVATLENRAKKFVAPTLAGIQAAAAGVELPDDLQASVIDSGAPGAYPIASYTYVLVYEELPDQARATALVKFLWWALHDGQRFAAPLDYGALPAQAQAKVEKALRRIRVGEKPVLAP